MPELKIEHWPVERLRPYENNPRKNDHAVNRMVDALKEFGFRVPVLAKSDGELIDVPKPARSDLHPTMKPVALIERMMSNSSPRGGIVGDFFGGSGSTLMACERLGRKARLMELDPRFADVIVKRWQDYSGGVAARESDGVSFDEASR